jgi:ribose 5-phosphate isomerase B
MRIGLANDHAGYSLKRTVMMYLKSKGYEVVDLGTHTEASVDYPDFAGLLCRELLGSHFELGILICASGIGMSIAANRYKGIRAALCTEGVNSAELARKHNNANVLCLGARLISEELALKIVDVFLSTEFEGNRHIRRLEKIDFIV